MSLILQEASPAWSDHAVPPRQQERASFNVQTVFKAQLYHVCCGPLAKERLTVELSICVTGDYQCCGYSGGRIGVYFCSCANVSFRG